MIFGNINNIKLNLKIIKYIIFLIISWFFREKLWSEVRNFVASRSVNSLPSREEMDGGYEFWVG